MSRVAKGIISGAYLFISLPFGIIFLLMLFTIFKNLNSTGYVYVKGIFDFIFIYIFLNFLLSFLMGALLLAVSEVNAGLLKTVTLLTFVLLLHDLPPLKTLVEDMQAGIPIGIPWPALLLAAHAILFIMLATTLRRHGSANARTEIGEEDPA
jgi:hypothetical protein